MRVALHTMILEHLSSLALDEPTTLSGEEARHAARVKRLAPGQRVRLIDGSGRVVIAQIDETGRTLVVTPQAVETAPELRPELHVRTAAPKGQRLEKMIDMLTQTGAASWGALETTRSVVEPGAGKFARLERVVREATKQCGRARFLRIDASIGLAGTVAEAREAGGRLIVADSAGERYEAGGGDDRVWLLVGPEGGFTAEEREVLRESGAGFVRLGPCVMRIETAAVAGAVTNMSG